MSDILKLEQDIKKIIDELKGICNTKGLSNTANEEVVVTSVFLYKFLNDRFMYNLNTYAKDMKVSVDDVLANKGDL